MSVARDIETATRVHLDDNRPLEVMKGNDGRIRKVALARAARRAPLAARSPLMQLLAASLDRRRRHRPRRACTHSVASHRHRRHYCRFLCSARSLANKQENARAPLNSLRRAAMKRTKKNETTIVERLRLFTNSHIRMPSSLRLSNHSLFI